jgi:hypothetical protein
MAVADVVNKGIRSYNTGVDWFQIRGPPMRGQGEQIRHFILKNVEDHPQDIAAVAAHHFQVSRSAITRHIDILTDDGKLAATGKTRSRRYSLMTHKTSLCLGISEHRDEDKVWHNLVAPQLEEYRGNILRICYYGFTEMLNNVIDHSEGSGAVVTIVKSAARLRITINDDGVGIFEKIRTRFNLADNRQAILELSKGKLTTDPDHHSGQGIFFTSRAFDRFCILSSQLFFSHDSDEADDWLIESKGTGEGTFVAMEVDADCTRSLVSVFDQFSSGREDDYAFSRTHVPLSLAKYGNEDLMSRSQAKRILVRFDRFKEVFLDFRGVDFIGQAFADEIFRVFPAQNPTIRLIHINANDVVSRMIQWVKEGYPNQDENPGDNWTHVAHT